MAVTVEELMSRSITTVTPETTVEVARRALEDGRMRHLPVVDEQRRLIGVLSDRDLLAAHDADAKPVSSIMTGEPVTVFSDTPAYEAVALMVHHRFGCLPVVDTARRVIGLITETDLLMEAHELFASDLASAAASAEDRTRIEHEELRERLAHVREARSPDRAVVALDELHRFLARHFEHEQRVHGLFARITERLPELAPEVEALREQHRSMLATIEALLRDNRFLARAGAVDVSGDIERLVQHIEDHEMNEAKLVRRVISEGGTSG